MRPSRGYGSRRNATGVGISRCWRTLAPGRRQVNLLSVRKREHSRKPEAFYDLIERCSPGPRLELFARYHRDGWTQWGDELHKEPGEALQPAGNEH